MHIEELLQQRTLAGMILVDFLDYCLNVYPEEIQSMVFVLVLYYFH